MWGGGFWGTDREEQWRRRKAKEYKRESQIRGEEDDVRGRLIEQHQEDLQSKDNVLHLTRQMLSVSRSREESACHNTGDDDDDDDDDDDNDEARKMPAAKRPRVNDDAVGSELGVTTTTDKQTQNAASIKTERKADPIQENLLCLSYAMFDSLFGTDSFNPKSFCGFLLTSGARSLAEEIGLAAIENSNGKPCNVSYVLDNLVPGAADPGDLVARVKVLLEHREASDAGRAVLLDWQIQHGDTEAAFQSALKITDQTTLVKRCLPLLEGKEERRRRLKEASPRLCSDFVTSPFADSEWPDFLASVDLPNVHRYEYREWQPSLKIYLKYAATSMLPSAGTRVGSHAVANCVRSASNRLHYSNDRDSFGGISSVRSEDLARASIISKRKEATKEMDKALMDVHNMMVLDEEVKGYLQKLFIVPLDILAQEIDKVSKIPQSGCNVGHRTLFIAYKCSKCREGFGKATKMLGTLVGARQHDTTRDNARFTAIGLDGDPGSVLKKLGYHPAAVDAMLFEVDTATLKKVS